MRGKTNLKGLTQRTPAAIAAALLLFVALSAIAVPAAQAEGYDHPLFGHGPYFLNDPYNTGLPVETDLMVPWVPAGLSPFSPHLYDALTITMPNEINAFDEADLEEAIQGVASCPNPAEPLEPISSTVCIPYEQEGDPAPGDTSAGCDGSLLSYCVYYEATGTWRVHIVFSEGQALGSLLSLRLPGTVQGMSDDFGLKAEFGGDDFEEPVHYTTTSISGLKIRSEAGGAGEEVAEIELREGPEEEKTVYAAAYDEADEFIDDAWVAWATGDNAEATPDEGIQTTVTPVTAGEDVLSASHPDVSTTAGINVLDPAPTEVKICLDGDCSGGIVDVILGGAKTFDAVDQSNEPVEVEWSLDNDIGSLDTETGTSTTFTATSTGIGALSAQFEGGEPEDSLIIHAKEGVLDEIRICQEAGGCDPITPPLTVTAGVDEEFFAAGYNEFGEFIGDQEAEWRVTPDSAGDFAGNVFTPKDDDGGTITADVDGITDNLELEIEPGEFKELQINLDPDPVGGDLEYQAGETLGLQAVGFDEFMNEIGPIEADWSVLGGIGEVDPESGKATEFTAMDVGSGRVKATSDGISAETGLIHVIPGPLDDVIIQHGPSAGSKPVNAFVTTTDGDPSKEYRHWVLFAVGYDAFGNWIGPIEETVWDIDDDAYGNVTPAGGSTEFKPHTPGVVSLSATSTQDVDGKATAVDDAGPITIVHGALRVLKVQDAPDGLGDEINALEMEAGDTQQMWAAGFDGDENYVGDRFVNWTVDPACGEIMDLPGLGESPGILFQATTVVDEECFVAAHHEEDQTIPGTDIEITVETTGQAGPITVNPGPGVVLSIRDEEGDPVQNPTYTAGIQATLVARMSDDYGNSAGDEVDADWRVGGDCGTLDMDSGSRVIFEARTATEEEDDCRVFAEVETEGLLGLIPETLEADTGTITVNPDNSAAFVKIRNQPNNQGIELTEITLSTDEEQTVYAAAYDELFNYIGDHEDTAWTVDGDGLNYDDGGGSSTLEPMIPGAVTLEAKIHGATAQLDVIMEIGALDHIEIRDVDDEVVDGFSIDANAEKDLFAFGLDAKDNEIGALSVDWDVLGGCGMVTPASGDTTTFKAGVISLPGCTVEATHEGLSQDVGDITVVPPLPQSVEIHDAAGGEGEEVDTIDLEAGQSLVLHAAGFFDFTADEGLEYIGDQEGTWSVIGGCGVFVDEDGVELEDPPAETSTVTFQARNVLDSDCQVKVDVDGIDGLIDDVTGLIDVSPGPLAVLTIHHLGGDEVIDTVTVASGGDHEFEAVGVDEFGNLRPSEGASWEITENPACGSFTDEGATPTNTFVGDIALTCTIRAAISGIDDLAEINVIPGDAHELQVLVQGNPPVIGGSVPAGEAFNVWVQVHDAAGNKVIGEDATVTMSVDDPLATVEDESLDGATRDVGYDRARFDEVRLYRSDLTLGRELTLEASADNPVIQSGAATLRIIAGDPFAIDVDAPATVAIDDPAEVTLLVTDEWDNLVEDEEVVNVLWERNSLFVQGLLVVDGDQVAPEPGQSVEAETRDGEVHAVLHTLSVDEAHEYEVNAEAGDVFGTSGPIEVALPSL